MTFSFTVAEHRVCFEHRDLHWGNVMVSTTTEKTIDYDVGGSEALQVKTEGVRATIIDFTLSR